MSESFGVPRYNPEEHEPEDPHIQEEEEGRGHTENSGAERERKARTGPFVAATAFATVLGASAPDPAAGQERFEPTKIERVQSQESYEQRIWKGVQAVQEKLQPGGEYYERLRSDDLSKEELLQILHTMQGEIVGLNNILTAYRIDGHLPEGAPEEITRLIENVESLPSPLPIKVKKLNGERSECNALLLAIEGDERLATAEHCLHNTREASDGSYVLGDWMKKPDENPDMAISVAPAPEDQAWARTPAYTLVPEVPSGTLVAVVGHNYFSGRSVVLPSFAFEVTPQIRKHFEALEPKDGYDGKYAFVLLPDTGLRFADNITPAGMSGSPIAVIDPELVKPGERMTLGPFGSVQADVTNLGDLKDDNLPDYSFGMTLSTRQAEEMYKKMHEAVEPQGQPNVYQ